MREMRKMAMMISNKYARQKYYNVTGTINSLREV